MRALLAVLLVACGAYSTETPDAGSNTTQSDGGPVGFGFLCATPYDPNSLVTKCYTGNGELGFCDEGRCWRRCEGITGAYPRTCPHGSTPIYILGQECVCEPNACATIERCAAIDNAR